MGTCLPMEMFIFGNCVLQNSVPIALFIAITVVMAIVFIPFWISEILRSGKSKRDHYTGGPI